MPFRYRSGNQVLTSPTELSDSELEEAFGGTEPAAAPASATGPPSFPAAPAKGKFAKNDGSGELFRSNGTDWTPVANEVASLPVKAPPPVDTSGWGTVRDVGTKIGKYLMGSPEAPTTGSSTLDLVGGPVHMVTHGIRSGAKAWEQGQFDPKAVTESMVGAAMLGGLGRAPRAFKPPTSPGFRQYRTPAGPPEAGPEWSGPVQDLPKPQLALPPGEPPPAPKQLPAIGGTSTSNYGPGNRRFVAGPRAEAELVETPGQLVSPGKTTKSVVPEYPRPSIEEGNAATLRAAEETALGRGREIGPTEQRQTAERWGRPAPEPLPEPIDTGAPVQDIGVGREPGTITNPQRLYKNPKRNVYVPPEEYPLGSKEVRTTDLPVTPVGGQPELRGPGFRLWNLTEDVPGLGPKGTTLAEGTIERFFGRRPQLATTEVNPPLPERAPTVRTYRPPNAAGQVEDLGQGIPPGKTPKAPELGPPLPPNYKPPTTGGARGQATSGLSAAELQARAEQLKELATPPPARRTGWASSAPDQTEALQRLGERLNDPNLVKVGEGARTAALGYRGLLNREFKAAGPALAKVTSKSDKTLLSIMLDTPVTPEALAELDAARPNVTAAYRVLDERFQALAQERGLPESRRISDYFPRLFENQDLSGGAMNYDVRKFLQAERGRLPANFVPFFEQPRSGAPGYRLDPHYAFEQYVRAAGEAQHYEPFRQMANVAVPQIQDQAARTFANAYANRFGRAPERDAIQNAIEAVRSGQTYFKLGFNGRWPVINWLSGRLASASHFYVEEGGNPIKAFQDMRMGTSILKTPEGAAWLEESGHSGATFLAEHAAEPGVANTAKKMVFMNTAGIETGNRGQAYYGEIWRRLGKPDLETMRTLIAEKRIPPEILQAADRVVGQTQGLYGKEFDPAWLRDSYPRLFTQFAGTGAKILYGLGGSPGKLLTYAVLTHGAQELSRAIGGPDMRSTLGFGMNIQGFIKDVVDGVPIGHALKTNTVDEIAAGRGGIASFSFTVPISAYQTGQALVGNDWSAPGGVRRGVEAGLRQMVFPNRVYEGVRDYQQGGSALDAIRTGIGFPPESTVARQTIMHHLLAGQENKAIDVLTMYNKAHPTAPINVDRAQWAQAVTEATQRREYRAQQNNTVPLPTRMRESEPARVRESLRP